MTTTIPEVCTISQVSRRILAEWLNGAPADADAALALHPELRDHSNVVVELAFNEFCQRREAGQVMDYEAFASRFPSVEGRLKMVILAEMSLEERSSIIARAAVAFPSSSHQPNLPWPLPGDTIAGCKLLRELGHGTFARVYLALEETAGDRPVALKVSSFYAALEEARTLGRLHHDHIVPIHWATREPTTGLTLVCMPFLGSATLMDVLRQLYPPGEPPRPPTRASALLEAITATATPEDPHPDILLQGPDLARLSFRDGVTRSALALAETLAFLHDRGLVHCDLKPSNLLFTPGGRLMLLDFNLARRADAPDALIGGTFAYMAPEQIRATMVRNALSADQAARADLFSYGVMLYQILTGRPPFGSPPADLSPKMVGTWFLERMETCPAPLLALATDLPTPLSRVIASCLAVDPLQRPASAAEVVKELRSPPPKWRARSRALALVAGLVLVAGTAVLAWPGSPAPADGPRPDPSPQEEIALHRSAGVAALTRVGQLRTKGSQEEVQQELRLATASFRRVLDLQTCYAEPPLGAWQDYFAQGRTLLLLGETAQARSYLEQAEDLWQVEAVRRVALSLTSGSRIANLVGTMALLPIDREGYAGLLACRSYCCTLLGDHKAALVIGRRALDEGYRMPGLLNNLGLSALRTNSLPEATRYLDEAMRRAPNLVAGLYNRCQIPMRKRGLTITPLPAWALADIDRAIRLHEQNPGHEPTEVYRIAAQLHALGALDARRASDTNEDNRRAEKAREYLVKGCTLGLDAELQLRDPNLIAALGEWLRRDRIGGRQLRPAVTMRTAYLVDPLEGALR